MKLPRLLAPALFILIGLLVLSPLTAMIAGSFAARSAAGDGSTAHRGLDLDGRLFMPAQRSLAIASGTTVLSVLLGVPSAFFISRAHFSARTRKLFSILSLLPALIPPYIHAIVWTHVNRMIKPLVGLDFHNIWGVMFILSMAYYPFVALTTRSGLDSVDKNLEEASLLCCRGWRTIKGITLPLALPHLFAGAIFVFVFSLIEFAVPDIMRVHVYPVEIFIQYSAFYDERSAAVLSLPLVAVSFGLILVQKRIMKGRSFVQPFAGLGGKTAAHRGRFLSIMAASFCFFLVLLSVLIPTGVLICVAGPVSTYIQALKSSGEEIGYSLALACLGSLAALIPGFGAAYIRERSKSRGTALLFFIGLLPFAIPPVSMGIGLIGAWNHPFLDLVYGSSLVVVLGYAARFLPFSLLMGSAGVKQLNPGIEEAALLVTGRWTHILAKILLPLMRNSLAAAFFVVLILSFGELGSTLLVIPPGRETIPIKIYNLMHYGADGTVAALCLLTSGIILSFFGLFLAMERKLGKGSVV